MKVFRYLLLLLCSVLSGCATGRQPFLSETQADLRETTLLRIETKIADMVHASRDWEMTQFRTYKRKDIDKDGIEDAILLTTFEHGMYWRRELFVCLSSSPRRVMHLNVGGKEERLAEEVDVQDRRIIIRGKRYTESDAMCCPSQPYQSTFVVVDGEIFKKE